MYQPMKMWCIMAPTRLGGLPIQAYYIVCPILSPIRAWGYRNCVFSKLCNHMVGLHIICVSCIHRCCGPLITCGYHEMDLIEFSFNKLECENSIGDILLIFFLKFFGQKSILFPFLFAPLFSLILEWTLKLRPQRTYA